MEKEMEMEMEGEGGRRRPVIFRDIRRYSCDYCGITRSKKSLLNSHLLSHHKEEMEKQKEEESVDQPAKSNTCQHCGASFRKPAHLKEHMRSHSIERPFVCQVDDCNASYRRQDHLTRHLLQHQGKLFNCLVQGCNRQFAYQGNMRRHMVELHDEEESDSSNTDNTQKQHICPEVGCGKVFKFASRLRRHQESHVKPVSAEAFCCEPGCMKPFSNVECLREHLRSCHQYICCQVCGSQQLKKNMKRHMRIHEAGSTSEKIPCSFEGCLHTFSRKSNLNQHIKAVHYECRPFVCRFAGCGKKFPYRHVRDNHEKTGSHVYIQADFVQADEEFRSRPRGGRKRKCPTVDMLLRKRITVPGQEDSALSQGSAYISWLLSASDED